MELHDDLSPVGFYFWERCELMIRGREDMEYMLQPCGYVVLGGRDSTEWLGIDELSTPPLTQPRHPTVIPVGLQVSSLAARIRI